MMQSTISQPDGFDSNEGLDNLSIREPSESETTNALQQQHDDSPSTLSDTNHQEMPSLLVQPSEKFPRTENELNEDGKVQLNENVQPLNSSDIPKGATQPNDEIKHWNSDLIHTASLPQHQMISATSASTESVNVSTNNSTEKGEFKDGTKPWYYFLTGSSKQSSTGPTKWMPDSVVTQCHDCKKPFDFLNRKHHCRYCGRIFCGKCSSRFLLLPERFGVREPQRVCHPCAAELEPLQEDLVRTISNQTRDLPFDPNSSSKYFSTPFSFSMTAEITKAAQAVENFFGHCPNAMLQDQYIPTRLLKQAKGLAFLTVIKAGFVFTGRLGTGLVIGKNEQGEWSAPSAIATVGFGWGAQIGGEVSDFVIILNTPAAIEAFSGAGQISLGAELGASVGPLGRSGEASLNLGDGGMAPCFTYSQSKGLFVGLSLEGAIITARNDVNKRFYGRNYSRTELLSGAIPQPNAAQPLYNALNQALLRPNEPLPSVISFMSGEK